MADKEKQLTLNVTTKHQDAVKGLVAVGGSLQTIGAQAKQAQRALQGISAYKDLVRQTGEAKAAWKAAETQVRQLAAGIKASEDPTRQQVAEFNRAVTAAGKLKDKYSGNSVALAALRQKLTATGIDTNNLVKEQIRLGTAFDVAKKKAVAATKIDLARGLLDVDNPRKVQQEIKRLQAAYKRLESAEKSGAISSRELAQAKRNLKGRIDELQGSTSRMIKINKLSLAQLGGMATGFYGVVRAVKSMISATSAGETSSYLLASAVDAANRQFQVGNMADWGKRIQQLSGELRIYSQTELETATAKTIEMTKRLGLSADQMEKVIKVSADLSAGKTDLAGGIERTTAALRGEAESAEYLGLTLNEDYVKAWYNANGAHEKAWKNLTDLEKAQVRYQVLLEQATGTEGRAANSINTLSGAWQYMQARMNDAIRNNEDLKAAIGEVTTVITEHAGSIVKLIAALVSAAGKTAAWVIQHKSLALAVVGSLAAFKAFGGGLTMILGLIASIKAAGVPEMLGGAGGSINAALMARMGLYGALAVTIWKTVDAYRGMREAQEEAAAAAERLALSEARNQGVVNYANETTGLQIENIRELNQLLRDGTVVVDELTGEYLTLDQAQTKIAERSEQQAAIDEDRQASLQRMIDYSKQVAEQYGELDLAAINAAYIQENYLNPVLAETAETADNLRKKVGETADAYYDAAIALEAMAEGESGYEDAQKEMLDARKDYVAAVKRLNDQLWNDAKSTYGEEERALRNSLERRKLEYQKQLQLGVINRRDYSYQISKLEEELQQNLLKLREKSVEKSAEIYGKDSQQYKDAVQEKIDAELDLQREQLQTQKALDNLGKQDRRGRSESADVPDRLDSGEGPSGSGSSSGRQSKSSFASGFYGTWDNITNTLNGMTSMAELKKWYQQNKQYLYGRGQLSGNAFSRSLNKHATDLYQRRMAELGSVAAKTNQVDNSALQKRNIEQKQITLRFQGQDGKSVSGSFNESDAGKLMDILKKSGMASA